MQLSLYHEILLGVAQIVVCINLSLRIYAIYLRSRVILFTLSFIFVVLAAAALFSNFYKRQTILSQIEGCHMMDAGMLEAASEHDFPYILYSETELTETVDNRRNSDFLGGALHLRRYHPLSAFTERLRDAKRDVALFR
ncbi:hypothetical protein VKT23_011100 [Stygiomarasmius scandens]|uniref:Uncharacterized protein n=1 Tax=Marasmiellus scandens TaxID=2682957 RepID=A0ABR1JCE2_9AGAR